jgi:ABC-2 type transport system permease protein
MSNFRGFMTLIRREYHRFFKYSAQTIAPPLILTCLFIVIFGYSLGSRIQEVLGFSYIVFIIPGLTGMGVITNAFSNTSTSLFVARMDSSIENMLVAPLTPLKIVSALVIGGVTRGLIVGFITLSVALVLTDLVIYSYFWTLAYIVIISVLFSCFGILVGLWAEDWDHIASSTTFGLTPVIYLGGVFYSITMLPAFWQKVALGNPVFYFIDGFRYAILGVSDMPFGVTTLVLLLFTIAAFCLSIALFRRGYKIIV